MNGSGNRDDALRPERLHPRNVRGRGEHLLLHDDPRTGVVAQCAAQLVVKDRTAAVVARLDTRRGDDDIARVRERDRAATERLKTQEDGDTGSSQPGPAR
jgi:hypothetical protein